MTAAEAALHGCYDITRRLAGPRAPTKNILGVAANPKYLVCVENPEVSVGSFSAVRYYSPAPQ